MSIATARTGRTFTRPEEVSAALDIPFSDEQLAAITAPLEPGVIIAGAGSGKTTVMAARVVWLVGTGVVRPDQVLGLTFTRKAAGELASRVRVALQAAGVLREGTDDQGEEVIMTYDAFAGRLLAEHGQRIGAESDPAMITGAARFRLADRVVREAPGPLRHLSRLRPTSLVQRVLALDSSLSSHLVTTDQVRANTAVVLDALSRASPNRQGNVYASIREATVSARERLELLDLVDAYAAHKRSLGVVEFADQMALAARIVAQVPSVGVALREQFRAVLLDEYQDTSSAQATLLQGLFGGVAGLGHPVTAVGDPFQAIYGWRGAAASNILHFHSDFPRSPDEPAARFQLTVNRRSGERILAVANELASPLRSDPMLLRHDATGEATPRPLVADPARTGGEVRIASFTGWPEEAAWVADRIVDLHARGRVAQWRDCAVLLRRNADMEAIFRALAERDVPTEIVGLGGLLDLPEVADVVDTLRLVNDVTANPSLVRLLTGPRWRIGHRDLALLGRRARELARTGGSHRDSERDLFTDLDLAVAQTDTAEVLSLLDALADPGGLPFSAEARTRFAAFTTELARLRGHGDEPVLEQLRRVVTVLGLDVELASGLAGPRGLDQLAAFTEAVAGFVNVDPQATLPGMLAWLDAEREYAVGLEQATPSERNSVKLLTVHRAKGLEWDVVFLPGLTEKVFPSDRVTDNWMKSAQALPAHLRGDADSIPQVGAYEDAGLKAYADQLAAETRMAEDRLAYVAVTRARHLLVASTHVWRPAAARPRDASPYFLALAEEALAQEAVDALAPAPADTNPLDGPAQTVAWPPAPDEDERERRREAAALVLSARDLAHAGEWVGHVEGLTDDDSGMVAQWDDVLGLLEAEARAPAPTALPHTLSASMVVSAAQDAGAFAEQLLRPMPRPASEAASLGTRFHAWVERHYGIEHLADPLLDLDEVEEVSDERLAALQRAFLASPWAAMTPLAVEVPFTLVLDGRVVRGQIDAVFPASDGLHEHLLVDWKTSQRPADPVQLSIYREAWARARGVEPARVDAVFVHVASGAVQRPARLADRAELERVMARGLQALGRRDGPRGPVPGVDTLGE